MNKHDVDRLIGKVFRQQQLIQKLVNELETDIIKMSNDFDLYASEHTRDTVEWNQAKKELDL